MYIGSVMKLQLLSVHGFSERILFLSSINMPEDIHLKTSHLCEKRKRPHIGVSFHKWS